VLVGTGYWSGLLDWLRETVQEEGNISPTDVDSLVLADDAETVLECVEAVEHRRPRAPRRRAA